jgi:uroporphyrinogen-III synthase
MLLKGPRGRDDFSQRLRSLGITVTIYQAYHRSAKQYAFQHLELQGIINPQENALYFYLTSSEAVSVFSDTITELNSLGLPNTYRTLVTHPRIAEAATAANFKNLLLIEPGPRALEECLSQQIRT